MKCPFADEFGKWIECPHYNHTYGSTKEENNNQCAGDSIGKSGSWCTDMIGKAMLAHKIWIGNDY